MVNLILVLGDQLSMNLSALRAGDKASDVVVMAEVADEAGYVPHHPKKIAFLFAAMRKFAKRLSDDGWTVDYARLEAGETSVVGALLAAATRHGFAVTARRPVPYSHRCGRCWCCRARFHGPENRAACCRQTAPTTAAGSTPV